MAHKNVRKLDAAAKSSTKSYFRPQLECLEDRLAPAIYKVINTLDGGPGSLRQAILDANANPGADEIRFNITGSGVRTIRPLTALPEITDAVLINGYSQPGASANTNPLLLGSGALGSNAVLKVELDGSAIPQDQFPTGLVFGQAAANSELRGLVINRFNTGVRIVGNGVVLSGCFIGTNAGGNAALPNSTGVNIASTAADVVIGGTTPAARNLISGNTGLGVFGSGERLLIQGNFIGTDVTGTAALGNGDSGVYITRTMNAVVGGTTPSAGNLISGNNREGLRLAFAQNVFIANNFIGTDRTGSSAIANQSFGGIVVRGEDNPPSWDTFTSAEIVANVISGNSGSGIYAFQNPGTAARPHSLRIISNRIGIAADNSTPLGNTSMGIQVTAPFLQQANLFIQHNHIAHNPFGGVYLQASQPAAVLRNNLIYNNGGLSGNIDIGAQGLGGTGIWASPVITSATVNGTGLSFTGTLQGLPNTNYSIDLFSSPTELIGGHRAARAYIASWGLTTNASGSASFSGSVPAGLHLVGHYLTTTAVASGTSELSAPVLIQAASGSPLVFTVTNTLDSGPGSLRQAILNANANPGPDLIRFNIPGTGVQTLRPIQPLPDITDPLSIDGYTQPGATPNTNPLDLGLGALGSNAALRIELDGSLQTSGFALLSFAPGANNSVVRGLAINRSRSHGILVSSNYMVIEGNFIGTGVTGTIARGNTDAGVALSYNYANSARIGGTSAAARNIVSGNSTGILAYGSGHTILGNLIGTDVTGTVDLGNRTGVYLAIGYTSQLGAGVGNLISGNDETGVSLVSVQNVAVRSNWIGTDITGSFALGNGQGVVFTAKTDSDWQVSNSATIGGPNLGDSNIISGNSTHGIVIYGSLIGNVVPSFVVVQNNRIGRGNSPTGLGNGHNGVRVSASIYNPISANFLNNEIAHNGHAGIDQHSGYPLTVTTESNRFYSNGGLAIQATFPGIHAPTLTSANFSSNTLTIHGSLQALANSTYVIEFYANAVSDPSGYGEGERPLGRLTVTTNASGQANYTFSTTVPPFLQHLNKISATATRNGGSVSGFAQTITATTLNNDATEKSTRLRDGANSLFSALPGWGAYFDLDAFANRGFELPVLSDALDTLFNTQARIAQHFQALAITVTSSIDALRSQLESIPGLTVRRCSLTEGIEVLYTRSLSDLGVSLTASGNTYNDDTPSVLRDLANHLQLDGNFTLQADLEVRLAFGVDEQGFYFLPESQLLLKVLGNGTMQGSGQVSGSSNRPIAGNGQVDLNVRLFPNADTPRYRTADLSNPGTWLRVGVSGTTNMVLTVDLPTVDVTWNGIWSAATTSGGVSIALDSMTANALFVLPGLTTSAGQPASLLLAGSYANQTWTLMGQASNYRLAGFQVNTLAFDFRASATTFTGSGTLSIDTTLGRSSDTLQLTTQLSLTGPGQIVIAGNKRIDAYIGNSPVLLWIDEGDFRFRFEADLPANTFSSRVDVSAARAVVLPANRLPDGQVPTGPVSISGLTGSLTSAGRLTLHAGSLEGRIGTGPEPILVQATQATLDIGVGLPAEVPLLSAATVSLTTQLLGKDLRVAGTGFKLTQGYDFTLLSASIVAGQGLIGLAGLVPFDITRIDILGNNGQPILLKNFNFRVQGTVDLSIFTGLPGTPVFRIGDRTIQGSNTALDLTFQVRDGAVTLSQTGPITVGFANLVFGPLTAGATLTLGQVIDGRLDTSQRRLTLDLDSSDIDFSVNASLNTNAQGITTLDAQGTFTVAKIQPSGMPFELQDLELNLRLLLSVNGNLQLVGTPSLTLNGGAVRKATLKVNDWVTFEGTQTRFNFQAVGQDVFVSFGRLSLVFDKGFSLLNGWGGEVGGFGVTTAGKLVVFDNAFARVTIPPNADIQWPQWLPIRFNRLGFKLGDRTVQGDSDSFAGAPDPFAPRTFLDRLNDFSIIVSGGFEQRENWPIAASVDNLEINLPRLIDYVQGKPNTPFPFRLPGGSIAVGPFNLGENLSIKGQLSFGTVEYRGREELYVIVSGGFQFQDIGADITLAISSVGPVIASVSVPLAIPMGPTGFLLSGASGALLFGRSIPDVDEPTELIDPKNDSRFANPFDQIASGGINAFVRQTVLQAMQTQTVTWATPMTLLLKGSFTHVAVAGLISGELTLGANIAWVKQPGVSQGVKLLGFGNVAAVGFPLGEIRAVLDLTKPLEPDLDFAFSTTTTNNPLSFLLPVNASFVLGVDTKGLVPGLLLGVRTFVQRVGQAGLSTAETFFRDALNRVADLVRNDPSGVIAKVVYNGNLPNLSVSAFRIDFRNKLLGAISSNINALTADSNQLLQLSRMAQDLLRKLFDQMQATMPASPEAFFAGLTADFGSTVKETLRDGQRALLGLAKMFETGLQQAAEAAVSQFDPKVLIRGRVQPQIFGIPLGRPTNDFELRFSKSGFFLSFAVDSTQLSLVPFASVAALLVPLPVASVTRFNLQLPFENGFRDLAKGRFPGFAPTNPAWLVGLSQTSSLLGLESQLSGMLFPRNNPGLLLSKVQIVDANGDGLRDAALDPLRLQVPTLAHFNRLVEHGGFILDGSVRLPRLLTDPFSLIDQVKGTLPDPDENPLGFIEALLRIPAALSEQEQVGQFQLFLPDLFQAGLTSQQRTARINAAYLEGFYTGKLLGLELGKARLSADTTRFSVDAYINTLGLQARFALDRRPGTTLPRVMAEVGLSSSQLLNLLGKIGLPSSRITDVVSANSKLRLFSPGFDISPSAESLKKTGGIEFTGQMAIRGLLDRATFAFQITPSSTGLVPDFQARGQVSGLRIPGLPTNSYLRFRNFAIELSKQGNSMSVHLDGSILLFGKDMRAIGSLEYSSNGWVGVVTLTARDGRAALGSGFTLNGIFELAINTTSRNQELSVAGQVIQLAPGGLIGIDGLLEIGGFLLEGTFRLSVDTTSVTVAGKAKLDTAQFGAFRAMGDFTISSAGLVGYFDLTADRLGNALWSLEGHYRLELNTTSRTRKVGDVDIDPGFSIEVNQGDLRLKPLGDLFRLKGSSRILFKDNPGVFNDFFALMVPKKDPLQLRLFDNGSITGFRGFDTRFHGEVHSTGFIDLTANLDLNIVLADPAKIFNLGLSGEATFTLRRQLDGNITFGASLSASVLWHGQRVAAARVQLTPEGLLSITGKVGPLALGVYVNLNTGAFSLDARDVQPPPLPAPPKTGMVQVALGKGAPVGRLVQEGNETLLEVALAEGNNSSRPVVLPLVLTLQGNLDAGDSVSVRFETPVSARDRVDAARARAFQGEDFLLSHQNLTLTKNNPATLLLTIVADKDFELDETFDLLLKQGSVSGFSANNLTITIPRIRVTIRNDDAVRSEHALVSYTFKPGSNPVINSSQIVSRQRFSRPAYGPSGSNPVINSSQIVSATTLRHSLGLDASRGANNGLPDDAGQPSGAAYSRMWQAGQQEPPYFEFILSLKSLPRTNYYQLPEISELAFWSKASTELQRWELRWSENNYNSVLAEKDLGVFLTRENISLNLPGGITQQASVSFRLYGISRQGATSGSWWIDNLQLLGSLPVEIRESQQSPSDGVGNRLTSAAVVGTIGQQQVLLAEVIDSLADVDLYSVTVRRGQRLTFDIDTPTNSRNSLNSLLRLFDATGNVLASNNNALAPGDSPPGPGSGSTGVDAYLDYTFNLPGIYYVGVSNAFNTKYNPLTGATGSISGSSGSVGTYTLVITDYNNYQDLRGKSLSGPGQSQFGQTITLQSQIRNDGARPTSAFSVRWYLSPDRHFSHNALLLSQVSGDSVYQHAATIQPNSDGVTFSVTLRLPDKLPTGWKGTTFYVLQKIDEENAIKEVNEDNNWGLGLTKDVIPLKVVGSRIEGRIRANLGDHHKPAIDVFLQRSNGQPIEYGLRTWLVIHGRADNSANFQTLADTIHQARATRGDQVLLLDWEGGAHDNVPSLAGLQGARWIPHVADWVKDRLAELNITSSLLGLVGHSWGSYLAYEIAKQVPGKNEVIVALDPATTAMGYPAHEVNFHAVSARSWAFFGNGLFGSAALAGTAHESFRISYSLIFAEFVDPFEAHNAPKHLFTSLLQRNLQTSSPRRASLFALDALLANSVNRPWKNNSYDSFFEGIFLLRDHNGSQEYGDSFNEVLELSFLNSKNEEITI